MNSIEKLYELADVQKKLMCEWTCASIIVCNPDCEHFDSYKEYYPPFTAEKQLELIKWISNFKVYETIKHKGGKWFMCASIGCDDYHESRDKQFSEALAELFYKLWQDLNEEQRKEIKRILE